ncbi:hypothetical protein EYR40_000273 [Pleurotus pulmonarius]|nr:hypothetical protein EYR40_000273 [Pleurotus pulmonarius]
MSQEPSPEFAAHVVELSSVTDSKIDHVSLSPGRAEVTRVYKLALEVGVNQVKISGLPTELDHDSLRVEGRGAATIHDVTIAPTPLVIADSGITSTLTKEYQSMANKVKRCKDVSTFLEKYLRKIEVSPSDHSQLPMIMRTYEHESSTIDDRLLDLQEELEKLRLRRDEELKRTTQAQPSDPLQLTATIGIFADNGGEAEIALIYAVPGVSWQASYDIRINMQSKDTPFTLRYKAAISQSTGENWDNVQLTLGTVSPTFGLDVPSLGSSRLTDAQFAARPVAISQGFTIIIPAPAPDPPRIMTHATIPVSNFGGLNATYDIPGLISVPNDAQAHNAEVKNSSEYTLVAGPANVYIDGSFIAKSRIPAASPQESFECSLGIDPSVRTTYMPLSKKTSSSGLINKTTTTVYSRQAIIRNTKSIPIENLKILDRVPISETSQITVKLISPALTLPPPPKMERSPSDNTSILDKAKGYQFKPIKLTGTLSLKLGDNVTVQWEGEDGECNKSNLMHEAAGTLSTWSRHSLDILRATDVYSHEFVYTNPLGCGDKNPVLLVAPIPFRERYALINNGIGKTPEIGVAPRIGYALDHSILGCIIWKFFSQWPEAQGIETDLDVRMEFSAIDTEGSAGHQAAHGARNHNQDRFSQLEKLYSMKEALLNSKLWVLICYWTIRILLAFTVLRLIARGVINASKLTNTPFYDLMATLFGSGKIHNPGVACVDIHPAPLQIDVDSLEKQHGFPKWCMARRYDWTLIQKSDSQLGSRFIAFGAPSVSRFNSRSTSDYLAQWVVKDYNAQNQTFSPASQSHYQIGMGDYVLATYPSGIYTWTAKTSATGVIIADAGGITNFWGLSNAIADQNVPFGEGNGSDKQRWILIPV